MSLTMCMLSGMVLIFLSTWYGKYRQARVLVATSQEHVRLIEKSDPITVIATAVVPDEPLPVLYAPLRIKSDKEAREFTRAIEWCRMSAVPLVKDYFHGWEERFTETGKIFTDVHSYGSIKYPMIAFAHSTQGSSVPYRVKQLLWEDPEFQDLVRTLFQNIEVHDLTDVVGAAEECISSGYNKHVGRFILAAVHKGLVGECVAA